MKTGLTAIILAAAMLPMGSCKDGEVAQAYLQASFSTAGAMDWNTPGRFVIIKASGEWDVDITYDANTAGWCTPSVKTGAGDVNLWLNSTQNNSFTDRNANILVTSSDGMSSSLTLTQKGIQTNSVDALIHDAGSSASYNYRDGTLTVDISASKTTMTWEVSTTGGAGSWLGVNASSSASGSGNGTVVFDFPRNDGTATRYDTIRVVSTGGTVRLPVQQRAMRLELARVVEAGWFMEYTDAAYAIEYSTVNKVPKWVAWPMDRSYIGDYDRADKWLLDGRLYPYNTTANDYPGQVNYTPDPVESVVTYDKGHMCPSGDRSVNATMNNATFYYSNTYPQLANFNRGIWSSLEEQVRTWASADGTRLWVCCGGGIADEDMILGYTKPSAMAVPHYFFKVILRQTVAGGPYDAIGFWIEHRQWESSAFRNNIDRIMKSVDQIEELTGLDFFYDLPADTQNEVEARQPTRAEWGLNW